MAAQRNGKQSRSAKGADNEVDSETKRKFREALDRKQAHGGRSVSPDGDDGKVHDAHGPAKAHQMFRRKSGS